MKNQNVRAGKSAKGNVKQRSENQRIITEQNRKIQVQCSDYFFLLSPNVRIEILKDL